MPIHVFDPVVTQAIMREQATARLKATKADDVQDTPRTVRFPYPPPGHWPDIRIYFQLIDRFSNGASPGGRGSALRFSTGRQHPRQSGRCS